MFFIERESVTYLLTSGFGGCVLCGIKYAERTGIHGCIYVLTVSVYQPSLTLDNCIAMETA